MQGEPGLAEHMAGGELGTLPFTAFLSGGGGAVIPPGTLLLLAWRIRDTFTSSSILKSHR